MLHDKSSQESDHIDTRVGRLEGVVESLTNDIREISRNINTMGKEIGNFRETIGNALARMRDESTNQLNAVTDRLTTSSKPQWQTISAFVVLAITVLGMAGAVVGLMLSGQSDRITRLQNDTGAIAERMFASQYDKGKSDAFAAETSSHLSKLDTTLQREMGLMVTAADAKIVALDDKLQTELRLDRNGLEADVARIAAEIQDLRAWRLMHVGDGATTMRSHEMQDKK